jgi:hypothetical protein
MIRWQCAASCSNHHRRSGPRLAPRLAPRGSVTHQPQAPVVRRRMALANGIAGCALIVAAAPWCSSADPRLTRHCPYPGPRHSGARASTVYATARPSGTIPAGSDLDEPGPPGGLDRRTRSAPPDLTKRGPRLHPRNFCTTSYQLITSPRSPLPSGTVAAGISSGPRPA